MHRLLVISPVVAIALSSCDTLNQPISSSDFDPLNPLGGRRADASAANAGTATFSPGTFAVTSMNNAAFYRKKPRGEANADKLLNKGTSVKVVSSTSSYTKCELDSGDVGYIPTVMLEESGSSSTTSNAGEYQVYPPVDNTPAEPLPSFDDTTPPDGAIPTVIDPEAPASLPEPVTVPSPPITEPTTPPVIEATPEPPVQPSSSVPLPPNGEE